MGTDQLRNARAINILTSPQIAPYVDQQAVVDKFVLEEYSDGDPDQFKSKHPPGDMLNTAMGLQPQGPVQSQQAGGMQM